MDLSVRSATPDDAGGVVSLLEELGYAAGDAQARRRLAAAAASETSGVWVAEAGGELVGLVATELVPYFAEGTRICRITALVVSGAARGTGVGRALVETAAAFASSRDCAGLEVTTRESRLEAHRFYERLGFRRTSLRFFRAL